MYLMIQCWMTKCLIIGSLTLSTLVACQRTPSPKTFRHSKRKCLRDVINLCVKFFVKRLDMVYSCFVFPIIEVVTKWIFENRSLTHL